MITNPWFKKDKEIQKIANENSQSLKKYNDENNKYSHDEYIKKNILKNQNNNNEIEIKRKNSKNNRYIRDSDGIEFSRKMGFSYYWDR